MTTMLESKSLLAKLMATENLKIEQRNVRTASFDMVRRILTIPTLNGGLSSVIYDLFMGHEVGHALYTPVGETTKAVVNRKIPHSILNVVDDARIERKIKNKYPGLKTSFIKAYKELLEKDFFNTAGIDLNTLNFIDRANMYFKGGPAQNIHFTEEEDVLVKKMNSTETYDDVVEVSAEIVEFMKLKDQEEKQKQKEESNDDSDEDESGDYDFSGDGSEGEDGEEGEGDNQQEDFYSDDEENESKSSGGSSRFDDKQPESYTDKSFKENESKLFAQKPENHTYVNVPKFDIEKCVIPYKKLWSIHKQEASQEIFSIENIQKFNKVRDEINKTVSYLAKEFEMRKNAQQLKRASTAKTGELNMDRVYSYQINQDIFKKLTIMPDGKSHGLVLFLDWSASMVNHINNTLKQLLALMLFCKKVNIPFEVYSFTDISSYSFGHNFIGYTKSPEESNEGDLLMEEFILYNIFSSKMSASEFTYACVSMFDRRTTKIMAMHSTPLNQAIIAAMDIVPEFKKKYKLQIVNTVFLSDGDANYIDSYTIVDRENHKKRTSYGSFDTIVITDPQTNFQEQYKGSWDDKRKMTSALIKLLRARTQSNVIGFYLQSAKDFKRYSPSWFPQGTNLDLLRSNLKKDKYLVLTNTGYNEYYFLLSDSSSDDEESVFEVKGTTTRSLVTAFTKYAAAKLSNKVVLNRFIGLIS